MHAVVVTMNRRQALTGALTLMASGAVWPVGATPAPQTLVQGALIRWRTLPGALVQVDSNRVRVDADGWYTFGIAWDRKASVRIRVQAKDCSAVERRFPIEQRQYREAPIDQLPPKYVTPEDRAAIARIERENKWIRDARALDTDVSWFARPFGWPIEGRLTDFYGSKRILNGQNRRPHFGLDIAADEGMPIVAPQSGIVRLAEDELYYSGGTIILDHGSGVSTSYLHLSRLHVKAGQKIDKGEAIGSIGKTGRATGPHLCWRLNWFQERLDPLLLISAQSDVAHAPTASEFEPQQDLDANASVAERGNCPLSNVVM